MSDYINPIVAIAVAVGLWAIHIIQVRRGS